MFKYLDLDREGVEANRNESGCSGNRCFLLLLLSIPVVYGLFFMFLMAVPPGSNFYLLIPLITLPPLSITIVCLVAYWCPISKTYLATIMTIVYSITLSIQGVMDEKVASTL